MPHITTTPYRKTIYATDEFVQQNNSYFEFTPISYPNFSGNDMNDNTSEFEFTPISNPNFSGNDLNDNTSESEFTVTAPS